MQRYNYASIYVNLYLMFVMHCTVLIKHQVKSLESINLLGQKKKNGSEYTELEDLNLHKEFVKASAHIKAAFVECD